MINRRKSFYRLPDSGQQGLTSQASLRIALLGAIVLALFAFVFFRLWFLQVLSGDKYLAEACLLYTSDAADE